MTCAGGKTDATLAIQRRTETSDAGGGVSVVWGTIATVRAQLESKGAEEHDEAGKITGRGTWTVTIWAYAGLKARDRFQWIDAGATRLLNIQGIQEDRGNPPSMIVTCTEDVT